jgi:hypothetical protein
MLCKIELETMLCNFFYHVGPNLTTNELVITVYIQVKILFKGVFLGNMLIYLQQ